MYRVNCKLAVQCNLKTAFGTIKCFYSPIVLSRCPMYVFIIHAAIVEEQGEFGWIMSTAIVITLDYHSAVILDGESMT